MSKNKFTFPVILILVIAGMYFSAVGFPFIGYDNNEFIIENPLLGSWNWDNFVQIWKKGGVKLENLYIPLTYVTYYFETAIFGKNPLIIHLDNLLLHTANCLLLYYLVIRIGFKPVYAFIASLAFAIHPLQVEPVVWCMGRKDLLSTLFALLCMHSYLLHYSKQKMIWVIPMLLCGVAAMFAKPVMVIIPGILLLLEFFIINTSSDEGVDSPISRIRKFVISCVSQWRVSSGENGARDSFVIRKISIIIISCFSLLTVYLNLSGPFRAASDRNPMQNMLCVVYLFSGWLKRFFMFESPEHFYRPPSQTLLYSEATSGFLILLVAAFFLVYLTVIAKYEKKIIFGLIFFLTAFIPPLAHLKYTQEFITADRYGYFPLIGIFIAIVAFYETTSGMKKKVVTAVLSIWFIFIFINNISAVKSWSSDIDFWELEVRTKPESIVDNYFLGISYQHAKDYKNALVCYEKCIVNESEYTQKALISSGAVFFNIKEYQHAENLFKEALKLKSENAPLIYFNLAETYLKQKKVEPALEAFKKSVQLNPEQGQCYLRIAQIYLFKKENKQAKKYADRAKELGVELSPDLKNEFEK